MLAHQLPLEKTIRVSLRSERQFAFPSNSFLRIHASVPTPTRDNSRFPPIRVPPNSRFPPIPILVLLHEARTSSSSRKQFPFPSDRTVLRRIHASVVPTPTHDTITIRISIQFAFPCKSDSSSWVLESARV